MIIAGSERRWRSLFLESENDADQVSEQGWHGPRDDVKSERKAGSAARRIESRIA